MVKRISSEQDIVTALAASMRIALRDLVDQR